MNALEARLQEPTARYFFAMIDGIRIGQIGTVETEMEVYIRGVGILPTYRHRGHGHGLLAALLAKLQDEGHRQFVLDVATENPSALSVYEACGFRETTIYDYHTANLTDSA